MTKVMAAMLMSAAIGCGPKPAPAPAQPREMTPAEREQRRKYDAVMEHINAMKLVVREVTPIDGFRVGVGWAKGAVFVIAATNESGAPATVLWDESSSMDHSGESHGRLVPAETLQADLHKAHPPSPLAIGATLQQTVFVENVPVFKDERKFAAGVELVADGKIFVTIQTANGKKTWAGDIVNTGEPTPVPTP